jgi:hypothetical protein
MKKLRAIFLAHHEPKYQKNPKARASDSPSPGERVTFPTVLEMASKAELVLSLVEM